MTCAISARKLHLAYNAELNYRFFKGVLSWFSILKVSIIKISNLNSMLEVVDDRFWTWISILYINWSTFKILRAHSIPQVWFACTFIICCLKGPYSPSPEAKINKIEANPNHLMQYHAWRISINAIIQTDDMNTVGLLLQICCKPSNRPIWCVNQGRTMSP